MRQPGLLTISEHKPLSTAATIRALQRLFVRAAAAEGWLGAETVEERAWRGMRAVLPELDLKTGSPHQALLQQARWRVLEAIQMELLKHGTVFPVRRGLVDRLRSRLTMEQRFVLACLIGGLTWGEIARLLGISTADVACSFGRIRSLYQAAVLPAHHRPRSRQTDAAAQAFILR